MNICKKEYYNLSQLITHLKLHIRKNELIVCPYPQCKKKYIVISYFTSHLTKIHRKCRATETNDITLPDGDNNDAVASMSQVLQLFNESVIESNIDELEFNDQLNTTCMEIDVPHNTDDEFDLFAKNIAQFYLKLECEFLLPASTVQYITTKLCKMHEETQELIKNKLSEWLESEGITLDQINQILNEAFI